MSTLLGWQNLVGGVIDVGANVAMAAGYVDATTQLQSRRSEPSNNAYEGAVHDRIYTASRWMTSELSADSDLELDRKTIIKRTRSMMRNDVSGGGVDEQKDLVVGTGFTPSAEIRPKKGMITAAQADLWNEELDEVYEAWHEQAGVSGNDSLWEMSRLIAGIHEFDGESLTLFSALPREGAIPLAMEVIDCDRLQTPPEKAGDKFCRMGIQYNSNGNGQIIGYWIQKSHPGDTKDINLTFEMYPPERVCHVFEKWFAGQSRGLPAMARILLRLKNREDLDEAQIIAAQIKACFAAFVKQSVAANPSLDATGLMNSLATGWSADGTITGDIRPGTIQKLGAGQEMVFANPNPGGDSVVQTSEQNDRRMAVGINRPYEMLAKDWRGVSFAGGRIVLSGAKLQTETKQERIDTRWLRRVWRKVVDYAVITGRCSIPGYLYRGREMYFRRHKWTPQAWQFSVAPGEEIGALLDAVHGNLIPQDEAIARYNGGKIKRVYADRAVERQMERDLDIVPPDVAQATANATRASQSKSTTPTPQDRQKQTEQQ